MLKRGALSLLLFAACQSSRGPVVTTPPDSTQYIPGVSSPTDPNAPRTTQPNTNTPLSPLVGTPVKGTFQDGMPQTCNADSDCKGSFTHCEKDVPTEVGICTKECSAHSDCTSNAPWSCQEGVWSPTETKTMCMLTCVLNIDCPVGTSCHDGICGTPCSGNNCQAQQCTSHTAIDCVGDAVYWFDSCGDLQDVKETCAQGSVCVFGQCLAPGAVTGSTGSTGSGSSSGGNCGGTIDRCSSSTTVQTVDGCGNVVDVQTCNGGMECSGGSCRCMPTSQTRCINGTLWQVDSCGAPRSNEGPC
jgi:hypothetical protein